MIRDTARLSLVVGLLALGWTLYFDWEWWPELHGWRLALRAGHLCALLLFLFVTVSILRRSPR